jgi:hypothetical protein
VNSLKLGIDIGEASVCKYMVRNRKPPSQNWKTFLENHLKPLVSVDFFTVLDHTVPNSLRVPGVGSRSPPMLITNLRKCSEKMLLTSG